MSIYSVLLDKINRPYLERVASLSVNHCFPGGPSDQILDHFWSSFRCRKKTGVPEEKPTEASLDCKPNAHKCRDRESNPGLLIGAKQGKIRCANLLPRRLEIVITDSSKLDRYFRKASKTRYFIIVKESRQRFGCLTLE